MPGLLLPNSLQTQISKESNQNLNASVFQPPPSHFSPPKKKNRKGNFCLKKNLMWLGTPPQEEKVSWAPLCVTICVTSCLSSTARFLPRAPGEEQAGQGSTHSSGLPVPHSSHVWTCDPKHGWGWQLPLLQPSRNSTRQLCYKLNSNHHITFLSTLSSIIIRIMSFNHSPCLVYKQLTK